MSQILHIVNSQVEMDPDDLTPYKNLSEVLYKIQEIQRIIELKLNSNTSHSEQYSAVRAQVNELCLLVINELEFQHGILATSLSKQEAEILKQYDTN